MKNLRYLAILAFGLFSGIVYGQQPDRFVDYYYYHKMINSSQADGYKDFEGSPYYKKDFVDGILYLKDTNAVKLPLRYNIYRDEMEYRLKDVNYVIGNPKTLNKVSLGGATFVYLPFINKGGYFELLEAGKCFLVQKRSVIYRPTEDIQPITSEKKYARFINEADVFYLILDQSKYFEVKSIKSVVKTLGDQKAALEEFIKKEKIKKVTRENLIRIVKFYNEK